MRALCNAATSGEFENYEGASLPTTFKFTSKGKTTFLPSKKRTLGTRHNYITLSNFLLHPLGGGKNHTRKKRTRKVDQINSACSIGLLIA